MDRIKQSVFCRSLHQLKRITTALFLIQFGYGIPKIQHPILIYTWKTELEH